MSEHDVKLSALDWLLHAKSERVAAENNYKAAIDACAELGITNVRMARALGVSETAIRQMRKRMETQDY